jgi:hypothetical protein
MLRIRFLLPWALGFAFGALGFTAASREAGFTHHETVRLHAHFARVLDQLRTRDVSGWSEARQAGRRQLIALLEGYDRAGRFPRNEGQLARRTPIFIDRHSTRCAMAHLIERSGGVTLVARIAATRNLAYVRDLAGDAELARWLASSGLTLDEAALIQPEYPPDPPVLPPPPRTARHELPNEDFMSAGVFVSAALAVPVIAMAVRPSTTVAEQRHTRAFGVLFSAPAIASGLVDALHDGHLRRSGLAQLSIGAISLTVALLHRARTRAPSGGVPAAPAPRTAPIFRAGSDGEPQLGWAVAF